VTKPINDFVARFGAKISLNQSLVVKRHCQYFLLNEDLKGLVSNGFIYAGAYLGKSKERDFAPSFSLLDMIASKKANRIVLDKKSEWLFICGRDVFRKGITKVIGSKRKGDHVLVLNSRHECLGFGRIIRDLRSETRGPAVQNMLDIGDFLRREK
jgi:ribosome biogenesis protein Nip4